MADRPKEPDEFSAAPPAYTRKQRVEMAKKGWAIPILDDSGEILDGSCPIASTNDLTNAIRTLDQLKDKTAARVHIRKRASELAATDLLPKSWTARKRKRGRPVGSVSLTREREETILGLIRQGVFDSVAAEVAEVSPRVLREWVARGEGQSSRLSTSKLAAFARKYRKAKAEARAIAESTAFREHLIFWLTHAARSTREREGWTELPEGWAGDGPAPSPEELRDLITGIRNDLLYTDPLILIPECSNRRCRCLFHRPRTPAELVVLRRIADRRRRDPGGGR